MENFPKEPTPENGEREKVKRTSVCMYCGKKIGSDMVKPMKGGRDFISHGICEDCKPRADAELEEFKRQKTIGTKC